MSKKKPSHAETPVRKIFSSPIILIFVLFFALIGIASAATLGSLMISTFGTSQASIGTCNASAIATSVTTRYVSPSRYEIASVGLTGIPAACYAQRYQVTVADNTGSYPSLNSLVGTLPNAATTSLTYPSGSGPNINSINNTNSQVKIVLLILGP